MQLQQWQCAVTSLVMMAVKLLTVHALVPALHLNALALSPMGLTEGGSDGVRSDVFLGVTPARAAPAAAPAGTCENAGCGILIMDAMR